MDDRLLTEEIMICDDHIATERITTHDVIARSRAITNFFPQANLFQTTLLPAGDMSQRLRVTSGDNTHIRSSQQRRADG